MKDTNAIKKILFITHSYPAFHSANSMCDEAIISARDQKTKVFVLAYQFSHQSKRETINGVNVTRIKKDWAWGIERIHRDPEKRSRISHFFFKAITRIRQLLYFPLFPNYEILATKNLTKAATKIIREAGIDRIVCDYNGCDTLISGMKAAKKANIEFVPIFWDSMSTGFPSKYMPRKCNDNAKMRLERKVIDASLFSIMMRATENSIKRLYRSDEVASKILFLDIPFFTPRAAHLFQTVKDSRKPLLLVYGGATKERNFEPLIKALEKCSINLKLIIYTIDSKNTNLLQLCKRYTFLEVHPSLPKEEIMKVYQSADILINFGVANQNTISCKIFDYFSCGKPVISTYSIPNEPCIPYMQKYPCSFLFDERSQDISALKDFLTEGWKKTIDCDYVNNIFKYNTADYFWSIVSK